MSIVPHGWLTMAMAKVTQQNAIVRLDNKMLTLLLFTTFREVLHRHKILECSTGSHTISHHTAQTIYAMLVCNMHAPSVAYNLLPLTVPRSYCCRRLGRPRHPHIWYTIYCCISALTTHKYLPRLVLALVLIQTAKTSKQFQQW